MTFRATVFLQRLFVYAILALSSHSISANTSAPSAAIRINQLGYLTHAPKVAIIPEVNAIRFSIRDIQSGEEVYSGPLGEAKLWKLAGESVHIADFSDFESPGTYTLRVQGLDDSLPFTVGSRLYEDALKASIKAFYFNRASAALEKRHAKMFSRPAAHPDTVVYIHPSAASAKRPTGTVISSPKGWYDAGDFNKYIVNSNITMYTLLRAVEEYRDDLDSLALNIPESENTLPDVVDEILWNLDWMLSMQDPHDGGVYHKLTTLNFTAEGIMPHELYQPRYVVMKGTGATLGYAAVLAYAHRVLAPYEKQLPAGYLDTLIRSAKYAWEWSEKHPNILYHQPEDVSTGGYALRGENLKDEWFWASAELYLSTGSKTYLKALKAPKALRTPFWGNVETLAALSLVHHATTPKELKHAMKEQLTKLSDSWVETYRASAYGVPLTKQDFQWGSNANALNKAFTLLSLNNANKTEDKTASNVDYEKAARAIFDYIFGRNPTGYSFVTGHGQKTPLFIHHRVSHADKIDDPIPGLLAGGPQPGQQDKAGCDREGHPYPSNLPAKSYVDAMCSYASNEIAINWNAPLFYTLAAMKH